MRRLGPLLAVAAVLAGSMSTRASADTGGNVVFFVDGAKAYRADASHASRHVALPAPKSGSGRRAFVVGVVPSPDHRRVAEEIEVLTDTGEDLRQVRLTDGTGHHGRTVWSHTDAHTHTGWTDWDISGMAWAPGGRHLYFARTRVDHTYSTEAFDYHSRLLAVAVSPKKAPVVATLRGGEGLSYPTTNATDGQVAAVRVTSRVTSSHGDCTAATDNTESTIVVLDPATGSRSDLLTVTVAPDGHCGEPVQDLAWSPDGEQIAFDQQSCCTSADLYEGEIDLVAADGSDGADYRVAVPRDDRHLTIAPTWRTAHSLWFQRGVRDTGETDHGIHVPPNLYSVSVRGGVVGELVQHTHTPKFPETAPSFG
jgi:hypothetical protein